jgi:hypothetical protein
MTNPEDDSSNDVNASMQVYSFHPFTGHIQQAWLQTLLRDWIVRRYRKRMWRVSRIQQPDGARPRGSGEQRAVRRAGCSVDHPVGGRGAEVMQATVSSAGGFTASSVACSRQQGWLLRIFRIFDVFDVLNLEAPGHSSHLMPDGGGSHTRDFRRRGDLRIDVGLRAGEASKRAL